MIIAAIYLLGALHGLMLAIVLVQKKANRLPNRFLGLLMATLALDLGMAALQSFGLLGQYPEFIGIDYPATLLYGPFLFLYVKTLCNGQSSLEKVDYLHFIPFLLLLIYMIPFYAEPSVTKLALLNNTGNLKHIYAFGIINSIKVLHALVYVGWVFYLLVLYRRKIKDSFSTIEKINLNWLQHLMTGVVLVAGLSGGLYFLVMIDNHQLLGLNKGIYDDITLLATTMFVYGIGYMGLYQPAIFASDMQTKPPVIKQTAGEQNPQRDPYQNSGLTPQEAYHYTRSLVQLMEEQALYRDSDLKLAQLAELLEISPHNLTEIINRYIGQNFYDFVNTYRVEEVKQRLQNTQSHQQTLLALGFDAGFNSKSTFNAVFKKQTGLTPSQYRRQQKEK